MTSKHPVLPNSTLRMERRHGIDVAVMSRGAATVAVARHGAHVLGWSPDGGEDVFWLSPSAKFETGVAIRGGIPICWPWFGPHAGDASRPQHGFARTSLWRGPLPADAAAPGRMAFAAPTDALAAGGLPHVRLELRVEIAGALTLELVTTNAGTQPLIVTQALHTYFRVGDLRAVAIDGLDGCNFLDKADGGTAKRQAGEVTFDGREIVRIYDHDGTATLIDPSLGRRIRIDKAGSASTIVWNPGRDTVAGFADIPADEADKFVCIESGTAGGGTISVPPGGRHTLRVVYCVERIG